MLQSGDTNDVQQSILNLFQSASFMKYILFGKKNYLFDYKSKFNGLRKNCFQKEQLNAAEGFLIANQGTAKGKIYFLLPWHIRHKGPGVLSFKFPATPDRVLLIEPVLSF